MMDSKRTTYKERVILFMKRAQRPPLIRENSRLDRFLTDRFGSEMFSYRQIFGMLGPLILDQFFIYFIGMLTNAMISSSSQESVTAVGLVSPITMILMSLVFATSSGGTVIVAQYVGKGDRQMVERSATQVVTITFLIALIPATLLLIFADPVVNLAFSSAEPIIKAKAAEYIRGYCLSLYTFSIYNSIFAVLRGTGDTKACLRLTVIINAIYLAGSILFLNVMKLDIFGTSLAFNVARIIGAGIAVYLVLSPKGSLTLPIRAFLKLDFKLLKSITKLSIPFAAEQIFLNVGALVAQIYIVSLGTASVAANTIASSASNLLYGTGFAVATLAITVVGQSIGAGEVELAKKYGKRMLQLGTVVMILTVLVLYPLMPFVLQLYSPHPDTLVIVNRLILVAVVAIPFFWSGSYIMPSTLRAAGDANFTSVACLVSMWVFRVALGWFLAIPMKMGVYGVWIGLVAEWAARSLVFFIRFKGKKWFTKKIVD